MLLTVGDVRELGSPDSRLTFGAEPSGEGRRVLSVDRTPAFELSWWCGTCAFLFRRLAGSTTTLSLEAAQDRLTDGLDDVDDAVLDVFAELLPAGRYLPLLLAVRPEQVLPAGPGDYFAEEQVATWDVDSFWGLPSYPATPYYRTFSTRVDDGAHLYEFVVPMVPPSWNHPDVVAEHARRLAGSDRLTAVAVATLDVCEPAVLQGPDHHAHWCLTHFLLDGHHKLQAAAETGRPLRLLSLLALDAGLATDAQLARLPALRAADPVRRR